MHFYRIISNEYFSFSIYLSLESFLTNLLINPTGDIARLAIRCTVVLYTTLQLTEYNNWQFYSVLKIYCFYIFLF